MIVFTADLHLAPLIWQGYPDMKDDAYYAWQQIVQFCLKERPSAIVLGGDIWNRSRPDPDSVVRFVRSIDMLTDSGIDVYAIQGQHERATPPWTSVHKAIKYFGDGQVQRIVDPDIGTFVMRGFDCQSTAGIKEAVKVTKDECDILVIHQLARQAIAFEGAWDFDATWVPDDVKLILAGDWHEPDSFGRMHYSGSTHMRAITERGPRSFITVGKDLKVERVPLEQRAVIEVLVMDEKQLEEALVTIAAHDGTCDNEVIARPVVYARINADVPEVIEKLMVACEDDRGGKFLKTKIVGGGTEIVGTIELPEGDITLETCLDQAIDRDMSPELHSFILGLLKAKEPKAVCEETRAALGI